jgi:hypothetical protein
MKKDERKGTRQNRSRQVFNRTPDLGYYFIVTDAKETEINYLQGLRASVPQALQSRLVIKVIRASVGEMLDKCSERTAEEKQYREPWIVFDRDQITDFDQILIDAKNRGVSVGWSNPCIEIWFHAYFGNMPIGSTSVDSFSVQCVNAFRGVFKKQTGQEYNKADEGIYKKLCDYGDEEKAIKIADQQHKKQSNEYGRPSEMQSTTTLHILVEEIRKKIKNQRSAGEKLPKS